MFHPRIIKPEETHSQIKFPGSFVSPNSQRSQSNKRTLKEVEGFPWGRKKHILTYLLCILELNIEPA